jgi:hypothetical protein
MTTPNRCKHYGCNYTVPAELQDEGHCLAHYLTDLDEACSTLRRETAPGKLSLDRHGEVLEYISRQGERLARIATSGHGITDDVKSRILSTLLLLMNLREAVDRAHARKHGPRAG